MLNLTDSKYRAIRSYCNQSGYSYRKVIDLIEQGEIQTMAKIDSYGQELLYINKRDPHSYSMLQECTSDHRPTYQQISRTDNLRQKYGEHKDTLGDYLIFVKKHEDTRLFQSSVLDKNLRLVNQVQQTYPFFQEALLKAVQWVWDYHNNEAERQGDVQYKVSHTQVTLNYYDIRCIMMYLPPTAEITGKTIERIIRAQKRVDLPKI